MKNLFTSVSILILLSSCSPQIAPSFFLNKNDEKPTNELLTGINILITPLEDMRSEGDLSNNKDSKFKIDNEKYCVNASTHNAKFISQLSKLAERYFYQNSALKLANKTTGAYNYKITWNLKQYQNLQEFSQEAANANTTRAIGGAFGLLGAVIADGITESEFNTPAKLDIVLTEIIVEDNSGTQIGYIDEFKWQLDEEMAAGPDCDCAYYHVDLQFKMVIKELVPQIEEIILRDMKE